MKKILLLASVVGLALSAAAQPIMCGHRGCSYGLESSVEALENGAKMGYQYLESDVKVTKDVQFVLSHDDDLTRLHGTKTIATSTLEELQSEDLWQTRNGITYYGRVASLGEMLDICDKYQCRPLIELKWATGINSNDCSNIPALINFIESKGYRNKCIILTSMKPCLEYIRKNYPDITLQFLTGQYWANHFDWCVDWKIDVDIEAGYFDRSTVKKYHDKGLLVNVWTVNNNSKYETYGNMGCDYITTDNLDITQLPALSPDITFPPNTVDYPEIEAQVKGKYDIEAPENVAYTLPEGYSIRRAVCDNENIWYVLSENAEGQKLQSIDVHGQVADLSLEGLTAGHKALSDIALTADNVLVGCNLAYVPFDGGEEVWKLYKWVDGKPAEVLAIDASPAVGNWTRGLVGDRLAVSGRLDDLKVYVTTISATGTTYRIAGLKLNKGNIEKQSLAVDTQLESSRLGDFSMFVSVCSRDNLVFNSPTLQPEEYTFTWADERMPLTPYSAMAAEPAAYVSGNGMAMMRYGTKAYLVMPHTIEGGVAPVVYDYSGHMEDMSVVAEGAVGPQAAGFAAVKAIVRAANNVTLTILTPAGIANWHFDAPEDIELPRDLNLKLEKLWLNSDGSGNAPQHIDGTNAQQGTAVNGLFYVNDCSDRLIYMFDESGCIGSMPGGAGWGCCSDDAGNICVRDDKLTGTEHTFLIYPAGATPDSYGACTKLEVTVPLSGQTNFINASGDLLGEGGHIYLFSNKQNAVSILTVKNGELVGTKTSDKIALEGTTAGYVVPINDDPENFIYQVRASGMYFYSGGASTECLLGRSTTDAPGRNSTIGYAYFTIGGNKLLLHNTGANYKGGFAVRDLSMDKVYDYIQPIGDKGYAAGGNYSVANWLFVEKQGEVDYLVYQYCPANGMGVYRLYDPLSCAPSIAAEGTDALCVTVTGGIITATLPDGSEPAMLNLYSIDGRHVAQTEGATLDASALPHGAYIVSAAGLSAKVAL